MPLTLHVPQVATHRKQSPLTRRDTASAHPCSTTNRLELPDRQRRRAVSRALSNAAVLVSAALICTAAHATADSVANHQGDITPLCGSKPVVVGVSDGYGGNT